MAQNTSSKSQNTQPKALTNGSASKLLKPGDPGFVNPYANKYSTAQPGREYQQSRWSGQPLATSSKLPEGFFGTAKGTTGMTVPPTTAPATATITTTSTPTDTRRGNRGDDWGGSRGGEGRRDTRSKDGFSESHQRTQAAWKPRDKPLPTAESAQAFFGTPKVVPARVPSPEALPNWASKTDEPPQSLWDTSQVIRAETDRNSQGSVDQAKDHLGTSDWFTNPTFDQKDRPAQRPQPQAPPSSGGVRSGERGVVNEQERPPAQQPARLPEPPRRSEEAIKPRDTASVPSRPASQEGDPLVIQYPVGDGCWVKMVVYVERDSKTAYSRLSSLGRRQISGIKVKTPEQLGDIVKDIVVDEKKNLLG
ncbi:hypothetical protein BGZ82_000584 [Podila clonocystis]|nr:hypothetical protein BGZ82_000584 [Podila clonocystis]